MWYGGSTPRAADLCGVLPDVAIAAVVVDGRSLSPADVASVALGGARVILADEVMPRLARDRAVVDDIVDRQVPAYGVTTGLGSRSSYALPRSELALFSARAIRGRANAVGDPLPVPAVRAALVARLGGVAGGGSGLSPEIARLVADMLNAGVHPVIPEVGSIGAADLCQMAHVGLVVIGEGLAEFSGEVLDGAVALRRAGLAPARVGPKDGLVLCGASPLAAGFGALALHEAAAVLSLAQAVTALTFEGFRANTSPLDPGCFGCGPRPGSRRPPENCSLCWRAGHLFLPSGRGVSRIRSACAAPLRCTARCTPLSPSQVKRLNLS